MTGGSPPFIPNLDAPTAADNQNEPYLPYYQYLLLQPNSALPQVISNSYGDDEQIVFEKYAIKVCNMIGKMGLRGISVLESSGDNGVGTSCQSNDGKKTPQFIPEFPGTCPYSLLLAEPWLLVRSKHGLAALAASATISLALHTKSLLSRRI
jgi:tripeptidyl-peptidase I